MAGMCARRRCLPLVALLAAFACSPVDSALTELQVDSTLVVAPQEVVADGNQAAQVTVQVLGADGPRVGVWVLVGSDLVGSVVGQPNATSDANGLVTATVRSAVVGTATLRATLNQAGGPQLVQTASVQFVAPQTALQLTLAPNQAVANAVDAIAVQVVGPPNTGPLDFAGLLAGDELAPASGTLDANGRFDATWRATLAQPRTLVAQAGGATAAAGASFVAGPADANHSTIMLARAEGAGDGNDALLLQVVLRDAFGNPVPGSAVSLRDALHQGNTVIYPTSGVTDATGTFVAHVLSTTLGTVSVQADAGTTVLTQPVTFVPGPMAPATSTLTADVASAVANGNDAIVLTLHAQDAAGHATGGRQVAFALDGTLPAGASLQPGAALIAADGTASVQLQTPRAGAYRVRATVDGQSVARDARFVAGAIARDHCQLQASATTAAVGLAGTGIALSLQVADALDNPIDQVPVSFATSGSAPVWDVSPRPPPTPAGWPARRWRACPPGAKR